MSYATICTKEEWLRVMREIGMDVDAQLRNGLGPVPCDGCGYDRCRGWVWGERLRVVREAWPLCPVCGEDELGDLADGPADPLAPLFCYRCGKVTLDEGRPVA